MSQLHGFGLVAALLFASAEGVDCSSIQQALKAPRSVTYQLVTKDQKVAGQVIKGKTSVMTSVTQAVPGGVQVTSTSDGKSTVIKSVCTGGKLSMQVNGKKLDVDALQKQAGLSNVQTMQADALDYTKHKVGETWSGTLSSHETAQMSMKTTFKKKVAGTETIKTPAGTFNTYRVEQKLTTTTTVKDKSMPADVVKMFAQPVTISTTEWYAKDIPGLLVKSTSDAMNMTLIKYKK